MEAAPCNRPECRRYDRDGYHAHCDWCGRPAITDYRCNTCGRLLCCICGDDFPLTDFPVLHEDYETMCGRCCERELGVFPNLDFNALEDMTVLPCGHSVIRLCIPDQGNPYCRVCCPHEEED